MNVSVCANTIDITGGEMKEVRDLCRRLHGAGANYACKVQRDPDDDSFFAAMQIPLEPKANQRVLYLALRKLARMMGCWVYVFYDILYIKGPRAHEAPIADLAQRLVCSSKRIRSYTSSPKTNAGLDGPALSVNLAGLGIIRIRGGG